MNAYIIVEGDRTETAVYPKWLEHVAPGLKRIDNARDITDDCYYLFSACGIPSIFSHVSNAVADINSINKASESKYDYLIVCIDTEEETREYIEKRINEKLKEDNRILESAELEIFEQKVCMETWFLGNNVVFKENPQDEDYLRFIKHYNVGINDPEEMGNIDYDEFATNAQFHHKYLVKMFRERNMRYSKSNPQEVCSQMYLSRLIERYQNTGHISSFGRWYEFVTNKLANCK